MLQETGREPTDEELAEKLSVPVEKLRMVLRARQPIRLTTPIFGEQDLRCD